MNSMGMSITAASLAWYGESQNGVTTDKLYTPLAIHIHITLMNQMHKFGKTKCLQVFTYSEFDNVKLRLKRC